MKVDRQSLVNFALGMEVYHEVGSVDSGRPHAVSLVLGSHSNPALATRSRGEDPRGRGNGKRDGRSCRTAAAAFHKSLRCVYLQRVHTYERCTDEGI
ncbi:unnamed protein product [Calypogeia fissa]